LILSFLEKFCKHEENIATL